ncbi:MAG: hypothetical protein IJI25_05560 [Eubacterium sp.]|nr:hypothetical protein [Eubacterium sp.]
MDTKNDMIQLPPLPREMDADGIKVLWEYAKMSPENQERFKEYFGDTAERTGIPLDKEAEIYEVPREGIDGFQKAMKDMIGNLIVEISQFSCWLYDQIYVKGNSAKGLIEDHPGSADLIRIMSEVFEETRK